MDIRQSSQYAKYLASIGWRIERAGKWNTFMRSFPFIGSLIKIQRINPPVPWEEIDKLAKKYKTYKITIEFDNVNMSITNNTQPTPRADLFATPYLPTKTIHIDTTQTEKVIFQRFSEAKRRAVRKAEKNNVRIIKSDNIEAFSSLKARHIFPLGFLVKRELKALYRAFAPRNAALLLAHYYPDTYQDSNRLIAGVFLLFYKKTAYYWHAASTNEGKRLQAPTLLVWEALKLSKKRGCSVFDFEGIYDPRFPKAFKAWKGFTKFKKGFGGKEVNYPGPLVYKPIRYTSSNSS